MNLKLPWDAWGSLPVKVGMPQVCASHFPRSSSGYSCQDPARLHLKQGYASGVCAGHDTPLGCLGQSSFETGYAPGMRQPHSSLVILFQLEHGEDPATVRPLRAEGPVCASIVLVLV